MPTCICNHQTQAINPTSLSMSRVHPMNNETKNMNKKDRSQKKNLKKWFVAFGAGIASLVSCCMCCGGCCGSLPAPAVLYDDDELAQAIDHQDANTQRVLNAGQWCGIGVLGCTMIPMCCGCCCGCCGVVTPAEVMVCMGSGSS